jgi:hypothetical protein
MIEGKDTKLKVCCRVSLVVLQPLWSLAFLSFLIYSQSVGLLGREISSLQGLYLNTGQHKHRIDAHTPNIHAISEIRTHDHGLWVSEYSLCLRPLCYCDWLILELSSCKCRMWCNTTFRFFSTSVKVWHACHHDISLKSVFTKICSLKLWVSGCHCCSRYLHIPSSVMIFAGK